MVRILCTTLKGGLDDTIFPAFGRAPTYTIVDIDEKTKEIKNVEVVQNPSLYLPRGAGVAAAQFAINKGVNVILTGNIGPNAYYVLSSAGIKLYFAAGMKVEEAIKLYLDGKLDELQPIGRFRWGWGRQI